MCHKKIIELVDDACKLKQRQDRKLVEKTQSEITIQCSRFSQSETLIIPETQKFPECATWLFLRENLNTLELPSAQLSMAKRAVKHLEDVCTHKLAYFQIFFEVDGRSKTVHKID